MLHRDRDQDPNEHFNCALDNSGGWWYNNACSSAHLTGQHKSNSSKDTHNHKEIFYKYGGEREDSHDSWAQVEMLLLPN